MKSLLVVLSFALLVSCSFDPIATLDNFSGSQNLLIISNNVFPTSSSSYLNISSVYGGQRDLELVIVSGGSGQIVINSVADGQLSISYPNSVNGFTIYQLDGIDNSMGINPNGLNNFDGTFAGSANAFQLTGAADIDTFLNITVYTSAGIGTYLLPVPSSQSQNDYFVLFSSFTGNADFTSIVIQISSLQNLLHNIHLLCEFYPALSCFCSYFLLCFKREKPENKGRAFLNIPTVNFVKLLSITFIHF